MQRFRLKLTSTRPSPASPALRLHSERFLGRIITYNLIYSLAYVVQLSVRFKPAHTSLV